MLNNNHDNIQPRIKHVKMNEISNKKNVHVKLSKVIIQPGESICEDKIRGSINIISMYMPQTNTITKHALGIVILRPLNVQSTVKQTHAQREVGTH